MSKQEKSYTYFCSYIVLNGDDKMYSSRVYAFPQRLTTQQAIRAAERRIAETIDGVDSRSLRIVGLKEMNRPRKRSAKSDEESVHPYFVSYVASVDGEIMVGNTVVELDYVIQLQPDIDAVEHILREKKPDLKIEQLRLLDFVSVEG